MIRIECERVFFEKDVKKANTRGRTIIQPGAGRMLINQEKVLVDLEDLMSCSVRDAIITEPPLISFTRNVLQRVTKKKVREIRFVY